MRCQEPLEEAIHDMPTGYRGPEGQHTSRGEAKPCGGAKCIVWKGLGFAPYPCWPIGDRSAPPTLLEARDGTPAELPPSTLTPEDSAAAE